VRSELERSIADADHLLSTFNSLLAIARAETGSMRDTMTSFDLGELVRDAVELYEPVAEDAGIACTVETDEDLGIIGNRELLAQAIANLLDNAIKHGSKATCGAPHIQVAARRESGAVTVSVSDNGPGIAVEDRERVLGRFVRLEESRNTPGSGLGLSLVSAAAQLHGGKLKLEDAEPGLKAVLRLPLRVA